MNYSEAIHYLFTVTPLFQNLGAGAYKPGLRTTEILNEHFGHPHHNFRSIHVAGTNGKGSCCHTLAAILQAAGYKVGLFTSPHLLDFRERIRINGKKISEQYVIDFVEKERSFFEPLHPSFFEITTAMAFKYFAEEKVDVAIVEVGLGGRLDCTNIISPELSIITNISLDHQIFLGNTLAEIASEKAGIIKKGIPVVIGETVLETRPVFEERARVSDTKIIFAEDSPIVLNTFINGKDFKVYNTTIYGEIYGALIGDCQDKNANTILTAIKHLDNFKIPLQAILKGFAEVCETTGLMGRWQYIQKKPTVVCDTGHNAGGWKYLGERLTKISQEQTLRVVFGMANDKDIDSVLETLPKAAQYYWAHASVDRALTESQINKIAGQHTLLGKKFTTVEDAYKQALREASPNDFIFVGGSNFVVSDLLSYLSQ
ncbi:bifunctional folylpolyglutamate synthase/dihydrofolate synthase [Alloprevotella rava]|uniref:Dihydrofolate synthase/folylpolyglutamate synthase n=1 Tax=Alloprevotella rava TaxID=671218 RepID=A0A7W5ULC0_9BACT|nr:folylpolyglutamate synthase/dihydrofolate synthase family protein [Alloprevotella rava]MBB3703597.1 dihydrofolate synthase/folylpolyglutamate synthase [Alloprevotella rava]